MSQTRLAPTVCSCRTYRCNKLRYKDAHGNWQTGGSIISRGARDKHILADARQSAVYGNEDASRDGDGDGNGDGDGSHDAMSEDQVQPQDEGSQGSPTDQPRHPDSNINLNLSHPGLSHCVTPDEAEPDNIEKYNCDRFHVFSLMHAEPVISHVSLLAAMLSLLGHSSHSTSSWFLKSARDLLTNIISNPIGASSTRELHYREQNVINSLPTDIRTVIKWLQVDPLLVRVVCCPTCFALYLNNSDTPRQCVHQYFPSQEEATPATSDLPEDMDIDSGPQVCGADLFQTTKNGLSPVKMYAIHNLYDWIARLFSRPDIEDALEASAKLSREPYDPDREASDILHSKLWKEFLGPDGTQFTSQASNLTFGMFMDGINPYGNRQAGKHASITFIVLVCFSLPINIRYLPQNVFVVGIAPGPKEPSLEQTNWIIKPVVENLKLLWNHGLALSRTHCYPKGRRIFAAVLPFFADLPALRRALGFAGPTATKMCSYCLLEKSKIDNLNSETWPMRTTTDHKYWAIQSRDSQDQKTRKKILKEQGVRYSVMLELPYWDIIKYHVVDSMHNLLLGLLKWHCQRFWCMSDIDDEEIPRAIPTTELMGLLAETASLNRQAPNAPRPTSPTQLETETTSSIPFDRMEFRSNESSDDTFIPSLGDAGWGGPWTAPSDGKIILDRDMLSCINRLLPRIRVPTSIKRAIPILGKASFGRLKADEWRNLFTIQLPLILPVYWAAGDSAERSLFCNFAHLVSSINLALKRSISSDDVSQYRYHNLEYLKSSLILFPNVTLAPNHHMSIHLADGLDNFGTSRGWWSFPMERLMGSILKSSHNNRLGQLEISFLLNFCRVGNLQALMTQLDKFPPELHPFIRQLQAFNDPIPRKAPLTPKGQEGFLDKATLNLLLIQLNKMFPLLDGAKWISANKWSMNHLTESKDFLPVNSAIAKHSTYSVHDSTYCTFDNNPSNSIIALKSSCEVEYGVISKIFTHMRTLPDRSSASETWLVINPLVPCDVSSGNPFSKLEQFELRLTLQAINRKNKHLIHISEVLAQCAWIKYGPLEILQKIKKECIALVVLDR